MARGHQRRREIWSHLRIEKERGIGESLTHPDGEVSRRRSLCMHWEPIVQGGPIVVPTQLYHFPKPKEMSFNPLASTNRVSHLPILQRVSMISAPGNASKAGVALWGYTFFQESLLGQSHSRFKMDNAMTPSVNSSLQLTSSGDLK